MVWESRQITMVARIVIAEDHLPSLIQQLVNVKKALRFVAERNKLTEMQNLVVNVMNFAADIAG